MKPEEIREIITEVAGTSRNAPAYSRFARMYVVNKKTAHDHGTGRKSPDSWTAAFYRMALENHRLKKS